MTQEATSRVVLILAVSGRALAAAARRSGLTPLVVDCFADRDTRALAGGWWKLEGELSRGLDADAALAALESLEAQAATPPLGLVCGSGLECQPELIERLGRRWRLLGNEAETVRAAKDPGVFFATLDRLGIPHPETRLEAPSRSAGWLRKRRGGAGGGHIAPADGGVASREWYFQRQIEGRPVSTAFLSDGRSAQVFGFSEQWLAPAPGRPMRYGGAVQPAALTARDAADLRRATEQIAEAFRLRGLGSVDFLLGKDGPQALEVNARPGGTLDIFDDDRTRLLAAHIGAVNGGLGADVQPNLEARAAAIAYAERDLRMPRGLEWPPWTADIPHPGECIGAHRPICTVLAEAVTPEDAKRLVAARLSAIVKKIEDQGEHQGERRRPEEPPKTRAAQP